MATEGLDWLPLLLQTGDALFPTGAYAHSLGFEEAVALGMVRDEDSLRDFLIGHVAGGLGAFELPYVRFAWEAACAADLPLLAELDAEVGAAKLARETRDGSAQLGVRRLKALGNILPGDPRVGLCLAAIGEGRLAGRHPIVCGVQAAAAGAPLEAALSAYYYHAIAAVGSAALKLIRIGQEGVQRALRAACQEAGATVACSRLVERDQAGWFDPLLEIASMRHARAGERLFIS